MAQSSLRFLLLRRLLPAMLAILAAGAAIAYWVALRSATKAYDRSLFDTALAIAPHLKVENGHLHLPLTPQAKAVLLTDNFDQTFFAVRGPNNELLDGEPHLPLPPKSLLRTLHERKRVYYDGNLGDKPIRLAALQTEHAGNLITILAAETLVKRKELLKEIVFGMLMPELFLAWATLLVVWFGVRSGLHPLTDLRQELAGRSQADLRPVLSEMPEEIRPLVKEINGLLQRLERALSSQRHFVSDAAHQLRTPIAALQAQVEAALGETNRENRPHIEGIMSAARRLSHLVDQLLALARAEPSQSKQSSKIAVESVIHNVAETWLPKAIRKGVDLGFELTPTMVNGNSLLLQELISNLVDNALHHTPSGGAITVTCAPNERNRCLLAVEDSGPGIPQEERVKVFERFYQSPGSRSDGCGLGLAIVLQIASQHGGSVSIDQSPALGGALIQISLPSASSSDQG